VAQGQHTAVLLPLRLLLLQAILLGRKLRKLKQLQFLKSLH
jgi:hypothetical protein